ncbi:hypothetical protein Tco_0202132 [Tanacetum coccineum]
MMLWFYEMKLNLKLMLSIVQLSLQVTGPVNVDFGEVFIAPFFETVVSYKDVPAQPIANATLGVEVQLSKEEQNRV